VSLFPVSRRHRSVLIAWLVTALGVPLGVFAPAEANNVRVSHALFGVHDGSLISPSKIHPGSVRLWDTGTQWQQIETSPGHYDFTHLDDLVTDAQAHHEKVTMVVAMTPLFYTTRLKATDPPDRISKYVDFVRALMKRYRDFNGKRGISNYQVWNEGNIGTFWTGTPQQLARLTKAMAKVRDNVDPKARVIAPAMVTRLAYEMDGLSNFYKQKVNGVHVWKYVDAVSLSLYPNATYNGRISTPEDSMKLLHQVHRRLNRVGVPKSLPIWNTEINYGMGRGTAAKKISGARQASNVMRTYLLNAANGVKQVDWYRYDMGLTGSGTLGNTLLSDPLDHTAVTAGGRAFLLAQQWMHGRLLGSSGHPPCQTDSRGTYTCVVKDSTGKRRIYWNPYRKATVHLASDARHLQTVLGQVSNVRGGSKITVNYRPVMVYH
jgi:hypothetical protein